VTRLVSHVADGGCFWGTGSELDRNIFTNASAKRGSPNFFCLYKPYFYLQAWIDRDSLPPRQIAFPHEPEMSFEGEFYEIVNTHTQRRGMFVPSIDNPNRFIFVGRDKWYTTMDRLRRHSFDARMGCARVFRGWCRRCILFASSTPIWLERKCFNSSSIR
jgi:hypothetical protein